MATTNFYKILLNSSMPTTYVIFLKTPKKESIKCANIFFINNMYCFFYYITKTFKVLILRA